VRYKKGNSDVYTYIDSLNIIGPSYFWVHSISIINNSMVMGKESDIYQTKTSLPIMV